MHTAYESKPRRIYSYQNIHLSKLTAGVGTGVGLGVGESDGVSVGYIR